MKLKGTIYNKNQAQQILNKTAKGKLYIMIQKKINSMIEQHKFNHYQFKMFPKLYRGSESGIYQNKIIPSEFDERWQEWTYTFMYYNFFIDDQHDHNPEPLPTFLRLVFDPYRDFLLVELIPEQEENAAYEFDIDTLFENNYSIEQILKDFENIFLETPCFFLDKKDHSDTEGHSDTEVHLKSCTIYDFEDMYNTLAIEQRQREEMEQRSLALAMFGHNRLASESLARSVPLDVLPLIQRMGIGYHDP